MIDENLKATTNEHTELVEFGGTLEIENEKSTTNEHTELVEFGGTLEKKIEQIRIQLQVMKEHRNNLTTKQSSFTSVQLDDTDDPDDPVGLANRLFESKSSNVSWDPPTPKYDHGAGFIFHEVPAPNSYSYNTNDIGNLANNSYAAVYGQSWQDCLMQPNRDLEVTTTNQLCGRAMQQPQVVSSFAELMGFT